MEEKKNYDVVIIGGSYAGLSAAMALGRAIRNVIIIDSGKPCNIQTPHSHNFLTQDGSTPAAIAAISKAQVLAYPTIHFKNDQVVKVEGENNQFVVSTLRGESVQAKKIIFATGVKDLLPDITNFASCWGISVIHCPYCHGYEYRGQQTGILVNGDMAFEFGRLIHNWTEHLTIFTNGKSTITAIDQQKLADLNIPVVEKQLQKLEHRNGYLDRIIFDDGESHTLTALYARVNFEQHSSIPKDLGCDFTDAGHLVVDDFQKTTLPGIYAAGDNTTMLRSVSSSIAAGTKAGAFINHELLA